MLALEQVGQALWNVHLRLVADVNADLRGMKIVRDSLW